MSEPMGTDGEGHREARDRRRDTRLVATGVVAVLLVWFALDNLQSVKIHFWVHTTKAPLVVVVAIAVGLGAAVVLLASRFTKSTSRPTSTGVSRTAGEAGDRRQGSASSIWEATRTSSASCQGPVTSWTPTGTGRSPPGDGLGDREADRGLAAHVERRGEGGHRQRVDRDAGRLRVGLLEEVPATGGRMAMVGVTRTSKSSPQRATTRRVARWSSPRAATNSMLPRALPASNEARLWGSRRSTSMPR